MLQVAQVTDAAQIWQLLWLRCGLAAAALTPPLVWELPCATGGAVKRKKKKKKKEKIKKKFYQSSLVGQEELSLSSTGMYNKG